MSERILDLAERPLHIRTENECLVLEDRENDRAKTSVPLQEVSAVLMSAYGLSLSQAALAALARHNVAVVTCDERRMPVGMLLPLVAHSTQAERFAVQVELGAPRRKRLWQQIVQAKLRAQAQVLELLGRPKVGLAEMAARVGSGDPDNVEAQGAQRYWRAMFGEFEFRRSREGPPPNHALNYGYAALRGLVSRAICGSGLHPSLGLHHHNRYDAFALASDLMEPFRPWVDLAVARHVDAHGAPDDLTRELRSAVLAPLLQRYSDGAENRTLTDWILRCAQSLARAVADTNERLDLRLLLPAEE
jgi:CRISPR-associated protein Cas1